MKGYDEKEEIKEKNAYIERLEAELGRGKDELLQVTQTVIESEKVINRLMFKLEGLEK